MNSSQSSGQEQPAHGGETGRWNKSQLDDLLAVARAAASAGARTAMRWRTRAGELDITEKDGPGDLVSQADTDTERDILAVIARRRPADAVLGEERGQVAGSSGVQWLVDPIDGTTNYLYGRPDWAVSVAALDATDGRILVGVVDEPALGLTTFAQSGGGTWDSHRQVHMRAAPTLEHSLVETNYGRSSQRAVAGHMVSVLLPRVRDLRRGGSAASALAQVATGRADALWAPGLHPWDCAAGILLVHEAGGVVGDLDGTSGATVPSSGDVLAAASPMWDQLRILIADVYGRVELNAS